jgi:hypothetical protein
MTTGGVIAVLAPIVAVVLWIWVGISVAVLLRRLYRRVGRRPAPTVDELIETASTTTPPTTAPPTTDHRTTAPPTPEAAGPVETGRGGFFAASTDAPAATTGGVAVPGTIRPTVAEALQGVAMPCGLAPVVDGSVAIANPFRVAFLTDEADAAAVGAALGDELARLGFTLSTAAATELLARKPGVELRVVLYPTAAAAQRGLEKIFPAAPTSAVGVEITT